MRISRQSGSSSRLRLSSSHGFWQIATVSAATAENSAAENAGSTSMSATVWDSRTGQRPGSSSVTPCRAEVAGA
jgi:hypothetical protein